MFAVVLGPRVRSHHRGDVHREVELPFRTFVEVALVASDSPGEMDRNLLALALGVALNTCSLRGVRLLGFLSYWGVHRRSHRIKNFFELGEERGRQGLSSEGDASEIVPQLPFEIHRVRKEIGGTNDGYNLCVLLASVDCLLVCKENQTAVLVALHLGEVHVSMHCRRKESEG